MTEEGRERLKEGGMEGAYLGDDGRVHIPGKKVTLYSEPSPPRPDKLAVEPVRQLDKQVSSGYSICHEVCCLRSLIINMWIHRNKREVISHSQSMNHQTLTLELKFRHQLLLWLNNYYFVKNFTSVMFNIHLYIY